MNSLEIIYSIENYDFLRGRILLISKMVSFLSLNISRIKEKILKKLRFLYIFHHLLNKNENSYYNKYKDRDNYYDHKK